jgi:hypothetical protein
MPRTKKRRLRKRSTILIMKPTLNRVGSVLWKPLKLSCKLVGQSDWLKDPSLTLHQRVEDLTIAVLQLHATVFCGQQTYFQGEVENGTG